VAILSKYELETVDSLILPVPSPDIEPRPALIVKVNAPKPFYMVSTHLSYQGEFDNDDEGRVIQLKFILDYLQSHSIAPVILAGDLNSAPEDPSINMLRQTFDVFSDNQGVKPTCITKFGWQQIDFITGFPQGKFTCRKIEIGNDRTASDHYALIADLEF
jgi:endonuclease/exonuclease/phosphatase family metal-dependent hydrolase